MESRGPTVGSERIEFWDVLRGVAVLGILLANIPFMALATHMVGEHLERRDLADDIVRYAVFALADTKFITIFSTLFGAGLAWMHARAMARGDGFVAVYTRRLGALAILGLIHATCIWPGDILFIYALVGCLAVPFRDARPKTLVIWAAVLFALNGLAWLGAGLLDPNDFVEPRLDDAGNELSKAATLAADLAECREVFASGEFGAMFAARTEFFGEALAFMLPLFAPRTLAMFLLGMAVVKAGWFTEPAAHQAVFRRLAWTGIPIGLALEAVSIGFDLSQPEGESGGVAGSVTLTTLYFGGFALAWGYVSLVALWCRRGGADELRARLAAVGRMALTSYLSHSIITAVIFNYLGQFDRWRRPALAALVLAIFAFQLWVSPLWLRHFRFGPVEWLLRSATYGRPMPLRRGGSQREA